MTKSELEETTSSYIRNAPSHTAGTETSTLGSSRYTMWRSGGPRRQSSLESGELEDVLETRRQAEQRKLQMRGGSTTPSDEDEEPKGKIRYNDMGSLEQVCS